MGVIVWEDLYFVVPVLPDAERTCLVKFVEVPRHDETKSWQKVDVGGFGVWSADDVDDEETEDKVALAGGGSGANGG